MRRSRPRWRQVLLGILSNIGGPGLGLGPTGGTDSARYCYSVWLRHLVRAVEAGVWNSPRFVVELGPGDSLGTGLVSLLTGAERYLGVDEVPYASLAAAQPMLHEIAELLGARTEIPDESEYPDVWPKLTSYAFPAEIGADTLSALGARVQRVERALGSSDPDVIAYVSPTEAATTGLASQVDFLFSQAVLEHVDDLDAVYQAMSAWVKSGGLVSHTIDFRAHFTANEWDGHWTIGDRVWTLMRGKRPYLLNRLPWSTHRTLLESSGFDTVVVDLDQASMPRASAQLASRFQGMTEEDRSTMTAFVIGRRR